MLICHKGKKNPRKNLQIKPLSLHRIWEKMQLKTTFGVVVQLVRIPACHAEN